MSKGKILVIDDSPIVRKLAEMALAEEGYEVFTAENGEDGLRLAEEIIPSVILVDFIMPRMSGYQFCQLVRENQSLKDTPIILITAKGDDVGRKFSERFGVSDYFIKPFKSEALVDKVNAIMLGRQSEETTYEYEPPVPQTPSKPLPPPEYEGSIPFSGFDDSQAVTSQDEPQVQVSESPLSDNVPFPFEFEHEVEQTEAVDLTEKKDHFSFDSAQAFDLPTPSDVITFNNAGVPDHDNLEISESLEIVTEHPAETNEVVPSFDLPSAFELDSSFTSESDQIDNALGVSFDESKLSNTTQYQDVNAQQASDVAPKPTNAAEPSLQRHAEHASFAPAASVASLQDGEMPSTARPIISEASSAVISQDVFQYIEKSLPFLVQKSVDNFLKRSGVIHDAGPILSGTLSAFDICDILRLLRETKLTGKLTVSLPSMSAEIFFDTGRAVTVSVSGINGEKRGYGYQSDLSPMQIKALLVDVIAAIIPASKGAFSVFSEELPEKMQSLPSRIAPFELIEEALPQIAPEAVAHRCDAEAVIVRMLDASALSMLSLNDVDRKVLGLVSGPKKIADLLVTAGVEEPVIKKSLYGLMKLGVFAELG